DQSSDGFVSVLLNTTTPGTATPTFTDAAPNGIFASGAGSFSVTIADFNMDGVPDLAVANFIDNNVNVLLNTITPGALIPSFASPAAFSADSGSLSVTSADFNGDGRPDLATANALSNDVSVLLNTSAGPATGLAIVQVNGGNDPIVNTAFSVVVESVDSLGFPSNVVSDTTITLSLTTGTGILGGNLTGTLTHGTYTVTISGVTYDTIEHGVVITATA